MCGSDSCLPAAVDMQGEQRAARRVSDLRMQNDFGMHVQQAKANAMASNRPIVTDRHIPAARRSTLQHYVRAGVQSIRLPRSCVRRVRSFGVRTGSPGKAVQVSAFSKCALVLIHAIRAAARAGSVMGTEAATYSPVNANTSQEERDARAAENLLAQAAKERERGTNYLRVGNLAQVTIFRFPCCSLGFMSHATPSLLG